MDKEKKYKDIRSEVIAFDGDTITRRRTIMTTRMIAGKRMKMRKPIMGYQKCQMMIYLSKGG